jgi:Zn-dependent M28 family amino/carboxypeptidase
VRHHQKSLQDIADANGGNRASGSPGHDASAEYVAAAARDAGLTVTTQEFDLPYFEIDSEALSSGGTEFVAGTDFTSMTFSGSGEVTGTAVPVDLLLPSTGGSTSGWEAEDFAGFPAGAVALLQRGTCDFGLKATNAAAAGASAAIIVNEGNSPDRVALLQGTLGAPVDIPVVGATFALAEVLQNTEVTLAVDVVNETRTTTNVFAEKPGATDSVLMVGAHLDSVAEGPGNRGPGRAVRRRGGRGVRPLLPPGLRHVRQQQQRGARPERRRRRVRGCVSGVGECAEVGAQDRGT